MADAPRRGRLPQELAVVALVTAASFPLARLFEAGPLGNAVAATILASIAVSSMARRLRFPPMASWSVSMLALIWFLSLYFFRETLWGPFPSASSIGALGDAVREGARQTAEEIAPVTPSEPLLVFVAGGVWMTTWLADAAATWIRNPLLAIASTVPLFVLPGAILTSRRLGVEVVLFVAAACVVLFADQRRTLRRWGPSGADAPPGWRAGPALRLGIVGAILTAVFTPMLPGFGGAPGLRGRGESSRVFFNPFVAIKPALDSEIEQTLFRVVADKPTYYRLTALDLFQDGVWQMRPQDVIRPFSSLPEPAVDGDPLEQELTIRALAGPWLPAAYVPVEVEGNEADAVVETTTLLVDGELLAGLTYRVRSVVPHPSRDELDVVQSYDRRALARYLELPSDVPARVREIALEVAGDEPNQYRQALALQAHLRTFTYNENVAATRSFDGIVDFLTRVKEGYCEQFAGSMAVLARTMGIPSRVAIGFGYGIQRDAGVFEITTRHAHAWVELFFTGVGWLAFEPTPRSGVAVLPEYATPLSSDDGTSPTSEPTEEPTTEPSSNTTGRPLEPELPEGGGALPGEEKPFPWGIALVVMIGVVIVATFIPSIPALVRRKRVARAGGARAGVSARYVDFLEWCAAAGLGRRPGETPVEHATRLSKVATDAGPLTRLGALMDEALWAPPDGITASDVATATGGARAVLAPTLSRPRRAAAAMRWSGLGRD